MTFAELVLEGTTMSLSDRDDVVEQLLRCVEIQQVTHDVRTFVFEADAPGLRLHEPGQHIVIGVDIDGETVERCYTISSPPTRPRRVAVTIKREPGGIVSNWLHDKLDLGARVSARGPYGTFSVERYPADRYLLLSGGSGATPMMSTMRHFFDLGAPVDVAYIHSARTPADILFRQELEWMTSTSGICPTIAVSHLCKRIPDGERWEGATGRIDADFLKLVVPDIADREVFACGPAPYLAAVREIAAELGVPAHRYHEEAFVQPAAPAAGIAAPEPTLPLAGAGADSKSAATFTVEFAKSKRQVECAPGTTLLAAAEQAGLPIMSSCRQGVCGTCKLTRLSGEVDMKHDGGIRPKEIAAGKVLACCSVPTTNVVLDA